MRGPLRTIILCPDADLASELTRTLAQLDDLVSVRQTVTGYPSAVELARMLRAHTPDLLYLSFEHQGPALSVVASLETEARGLPVVGVSRSNSAEMLREAMRAGVRDFLTPPLDRSTVGNSLKSLRSLVDREPPDFGGTGRIYSFLPSKPGCGATTVALNTAAALQRLASKRVLLVDLDLGCGMMRFLLKIGGEYSVADAASHGARLDDSLWRQFVTECYGLDVIDSGPVNPNLRLNPDDLRALLDFARRRYDALCFDLSGNMEQYAMEACKDSGRIFLVCTPEPASLQLGAEKLAYLRSQRLDDRVAIVLNRAGPQPDAAIARMEAVLGMPVACVFTNRYDCVQRAIQDGSPLGAGSPLGRQFDDFAASLLHLPEQARTLKKTLFGILTPAPAP